MEIEKKTLRTGIRMEMTPPMPETSAAICAGLQALDCWSTARTVLTYHPLSTEIDLRPLLSESQAKEWIFPRVAGESLSLHRWIRNAPWRTGPFGIREPDPNHWPEVRHEAVDLALIPGLAFDRNGNRLGRGKGFYDRLMGTGEFRALKIGIVTERFLLPEIPTESHDIGMDLVVTESGVHLTKASRLDNGRERE